MTHGHRLFAAFWDRAARHEGRPQRRARQEVARGVAGSVLELGVGVGTNWPYLAAHSRYVGIDPDGYMLARAQRHAQAEGRPVDLVLCPAERLPFADASFDTVLATLTLCTVDDVPASLAEVRRVLKPGGEFRFWEHVRPKGRAWGRLFDTITPVWRHIGAGCHPNRETGRALEEAGFEIRQLRSLMLGAVPFILGFAIPPDQPRSSGSS